MGKKKTNVEIVANILGKEAQFFDDKSASWIQFENDTHVIDISFNGKGDKFTGIQVFKKIIKEVDVERIINIK